MSIPVESVQVGKCYLNHQEYGIRVLRVIALLPGDRVQYDFRNFYGTRNTRQWKAGLLDKAAFARLAEREVPCDWTPETGEASG